MLEARDIGFGYESQTRLLAGWNQRFAAGEVVAITGPSGRGKSTLLYILGLMLKPNNGMVLVEGRDVSSLSDANRAHLRAEVFGFVFQDAALDSTRTIIDNVVETALYRGRSRAEAISKANELLERFGVGLRASARPGQVSGGQAQRIALCRALLNNPKILLADEPTGNLDPLSAQVVVDAFHEQASMGSAVIVVTHDPTLVALCDRKVEL